MTSEAMLTENFVNELAARVLENGFQHGALNDSDPGLFADTLAALVDEYLEGVSADDPTRTETFTRVAQAGDLLLRGVVSGAAVKLLGSLPTCRCVQVSRPQPRQSYASTTEAVRRMKTS